MWRRPSASRGGGRAGAGAGGVSNASAICRARAGRTRATIELSGRGADEDCELSTPPTSERRRALSVSHGARAVPARRWTGCSRRSRGARRDRATGEEVVGRAARVRRARRPRSRRAPGRGRARDGAEVAAQRVRDQAARPELRAAGERRRLGLAGAPAGGAGESVSLWRRSRCRRSGTRWSA